MPVSSRDEFFREIVERLGTTEIWTAVGYITPDGSMIDLSNVDLYPDPAVRYYTHNDFEKFFGYSQKSMLENGAIRMGYGDTNDIPYAHIVLKKYETTDQQWEKLGELLNTEPFKLDLEIDTDMEDTMNSFYKRYSADRHSIRDMKTDVQTFLNGDKTNLGRFCEKLGVKEFRDE